MFLVALVSTLAVPAIGSYLLLLLLTDVAAQALRPVWNRRPAGGRVGR